MIELIFKGIETRSVGIRDMIKGFARNSGSFAETSRKIQYRLSESLRINAKT